MIGGFILLETGSTRMKNAGHIAGKTILTFSIGSIVFWAVGLWINFRGRKSTDWVFPTSYIQAMTSKSITFRFCFLFIPISLCRYFLNDCIWRVCRTSKIRSLSRIRSIIFGYCLSSNCPLDLGRRLVSRAWVNKTLPVQLLFT